MTHLSGFMAVVLIALVAMGTVSSIQEDFIKSGYRESGNDQVGELRAITKPSVNQCFERISTTLIGCPHLPNRLMWTFDKKLKRCVEKTVDGCNTYSGNIFKLKSECYKICVLLPIRPNKTTKQPIRRCVTGAIESTRKRCGKIPIRRMWTFIEERNKCVTTKVDGCNDHSGNIFGTKSGCIRSCVPR